MPSLSLLHHDEEMITNPAQERPTGDAPVKTPKSIVRGPPPFTHLRQVGWGREHTQSAIVRKREVPLERPIEFARPVVVRPNSVLVHADGHKVASEAYLDTRPPPAPQEMRYLPRADAPDDGEDQGTAGF